MSSLLDELLNTDIPSISEELFVDVYLKLLVENKDEPGVFNIRWLREVSMRISSPVKVVNQDGETIFTVPPLANDTEVSNGGAIHNLMIEVEATRNMHKARGERMLRDNLPGFVNLDNRTSDSDIQQWVSILDRYGYSDLTTSESETVSHSEIEEEMDEW